MSVLGVTVVKVSHANAILQLVDRACAAAQYLAETNIRNFHFFVIFLQIFC